MFIGETALDGHEGAYCFRIVDFKGFDLKQLQFELHRGEYFRDKIIGFSGRNVCIRNNGKLLFGSLVLRPQGAEQMSYENHRLSVHKFLLCNGYTFEFFTSETMYYLLQTGRAYCLYQIIVDAGKNIEPIDRGSNTDLEYSNGFPVRRNQENWDGLAVNSDVLTSSPLDKLPRRKSSILEACDFEQFDQAGRDSIFFDPSTGVNAFYTQRQTFIEIAVPKVISNFNPVRLEKIINMTSREFLEHNAFANEHDFFSWMESLAKHLSPNNSSETFKNTLCDAIFALTQIREHASNFDVPAKFIFIEKLKQDNETSLKTSDTDTKIRRLTSEIIINACVSEQQDFIAKCLLGHEPRCWNDAREVGMIYWFTDLPKLKQVIEKGAMEAYKTSKNPWHLLFWLILFGKTKVLAGLFKLAKDQERFAKFFAEDFGTQAVRDKAYNNAFVLRSQKKYEESAAFFVLARQFNEAFEIILNYMKDIQLALLVFRVFEREIKENESQIAFFRHFVQETFIDKSNAVSDRFVSVIGRVLLGDVDAMVGELRAYENDEFVVQANDEFRDSYGFTPTSFCLSIQDLLAFMETNPNYKRFFQSNDSAKSNAQINTDNQEVTEKINNITEEDNEFGNFDIFAKLPVPKKPANDMTIFWDEDDVNENFAESSTKENPTPTPILVQVNNVPPLFDVMKAKEIQRFNYLTENQKHFLALLEMTAFKANHPEHYASATTENYYRLKHNIMQIAYKKLAKMIKSEKYTKTNLIARDINSLSRYFRLNPEKILKNTMRRITLIGDESLSLCFLLATQPLENSVQLLNVCLQNIVEGAFRLLNKDLFVLKGANYWMRKLLQVSKICSTLKNVAKVDLETEGSPLYGELISGFNEVLNTMVKVIYTRTLCFNEANSLINLKVDLPVMCSEFETVLVSAMKKTKAMHPFSIVHVESGVKKPIRSNEATVDDLESSHPDIERQQRQAFINLNLIQTSSPLNNIITTSGLNDYLTPSNLCLQLLLQIVYLHEIIVEKRANRQKLVARLEPKLERLLFRSQLFLIELLESNDIDTLLELADELQKVLSLDQLSLKRNLFIYVQPDQALHLDLNDKIYSPVLDVKHWRQFLDDLKTQKLLEHNYRDLPMILRQRRKDAFAGGVQIFRPKLENGGFFKNKTFRKLLPFARPDGQELFVWVHRRLRKISLFNSLFKRPRSNAFYTLTFEEDLNSISNVLEENIGSPVEGLLDRPPVFSALYISLFSKASNLNHRYVSIRQTNFSKNSAIEVTKGLRIMEYMIDSKPQSIRELKDIALIGMHPRLPIIAVIENTEIIFLSIKSMACLTSITLPSTKALKHIVFDENSLKFFVIDVQSCVYIYKFSLDLDQIDLIKTVSGHKVHHGTFFRSSTAIILTTLASYSIVVDLITGKVVKVEMNEPLLTKTKVEYVPELERIVFVNKRKGLLTSTDLEEFSHRQTSELITEQITCYTISGETIVIGYANGMIRVVGLRDFAVLFEQTFEDNEAKKIKVEDVAVVRGFVIVGLANGVASIVNKI